MGRRGRQDTEALKRQILDEAVALIGARGRRGTTIQDVARAVGISKQALMYHYPSKHSLVAACGAHLANDLGPLLPRLLLAISQPDRLEAVLDELVRYFEGRPDHARFLLRDLMDAELETVEDMAGQPFRAWVSVAVDYIRREQAAGTMPKELDPEAAISQVGCFLLLTFALPTRPGGIAGEVGAEAWRARLVAEAVRILLAAFRP